VKYIFLYTQATIQNQAFIGQYGKYIYCTVFRQLDASGVDSARSRGSMEPEEL